MITKISRNAFVVLAMCNEAKKTYGITVDKFSDKYSLIWAFKINKDKAHKEGFDSTSVNGQINIDINYPGCPYCGSKNFYVCGNCNSIVCYHGENYVTCPACGFGGEIVQVSTVNLKGGSM